MKQDIIEYDKMGFVPSRKVRNIDGYLKESEAKYNLVERLKKDCSSIFGDEVGVAELKDEEHDAFFRRFDTLPLPSIIAKRKDFKKIYNQSIRGFCTYYATFGRLGGSIFYPDKNIELQIPILLDNGSMKSNFISHESLHSFRNQWNSFLNDILTRNTEEVMAYFSGNDTLSTIRNVNTFCTNYCLINPFLSRLPILSAYAYIGYSHWGVKGGIAGALFMPIQELLTTLPQLNHGKKLILKGLEEGINMDYLFLRSNYHNLNTRQPITEQIARKKGLKWDVIRTRLKIEKSEK